MNRGNIKGRELIFFILVPIGVFLFSVAFDALNNQYWQKKLDKATETILSDALKSESIDTVEEYVEYAKNKYEYYGKKIQNSINFMKNYTIHEYINQQQIKYYGVEKS